MIGYVVRLVNSARGSFPSYHHGTDACGRSRRVHPSIPIRDSARRSDDEGRAIEAAVDDDDAPTGVAGVVLRQSRDRHRG